MLLPHDLRQEFPFLSQRHPGGKAWVYLDSAATTLKPRPVIDAVTQALSFRSTNVHRSVYGPSDETTAQYESARHRLARFIGAEAHEVVFVRNATEALNLVNQAYPREGATLLSLGEHHSNLLPWRHGQVRSILPRPDGTVDLDAFRRELRAGGIAVVAVSHISNVTGIQIDVAEMARLTHEAGAVLVVDAAQSAGRVPLDVRELDCDFLALSGHKMYGPSGIGALYAKAEHWLRMKPCLLGGGTVETVSSNDSDWRDVPWRFEAGTPAIEAALGLGAAVDYLQAVGMDAVAEHERELTRYARQKLSTLRRCRLLDATRDAVGVLSFYIEDESSHVIARTLSDRAGICVRSGHHCAQPLHESLKLPPTLRLSFGVYNQPEDVDRCVAALEEILRGMPGARSR
jgi:cysteine desulfurase / selenocysteine lyase